MSAALLDHEAELAEKGVTSAAQFGRIIHAMQVRTYAKNLKKLNTAKSKLCVTRTSKCGTISSMAKGFKNATLALALTAVGVVAILTR